MERVLITGANRGIGLALAEAYLHDGAHVFATARKPEEAHALHRLGAAHAGRFSLLPLVVDNQASIDEALARVSRQTDALDILFNNAGVLPENDLQSFAGITFETMMDTLRVNTAAPLMVAQAFADLLAKGDYPRLINISSGAGSIAERQSGSWYAYNTSKSGVNMVSRLLGFELGARGIIVIALNPGWVQTDMGNMGGRHANLTPEFSASNIKKTVASLGTGHAGAFLNYDGAPIEW